MEWSQIRQAFPDQWLIVEAIEAQTTPDQKRQLDQIAVLQCCLDGADALQQYRALHQKYPLRELYFVHTSRETLDIRVRNAFARHRLDEARQTMRRLGQGLGTGQTHDVASNHDRYLYKSRDKLRRLPPITANHYD